MNKFLVIAIVIAVSIVLYPKISAAREEWGACVSTGSQCGTDNGTQSGTDYTDYTTTCPEGYGVNESDTWGEKCSKEEETDRPFSMVCPSGYSLHDGDCRRWDRYHYVYADKVKQWGSCESGWEVDGEKCERTLYSEPSTSCPSEYTKSGEGESTVCSREISQSCNTGEIDYSACTAEEQCPTACGLPSSEVADGLGGLKQCEATIACVVDVCENLDGVQESTPEGYVNNDGVCTVKEEPKEEPKPVEKKRVFHSLKGCYGPTPEKPQWAIKVPAKGGIIAKWSAMGGEKVQIEVTNSKGEYEYKYSGINDGSMYLPNVAMSQIYRIRVLRGCKESQWLVDR